MPKLVYLEKKISKIEFEKFSRQFRVSPPLSFKRHYLDSNGGAPSEEDREKNKWGLPINSFFPIKYGKLTIETLVLDLNELECFQEFGADSYIPFASDDGGNVIFLSLRDEDFGRIYAFVMDGYEFFNILPSFDELIRKLYKLR